MFYRYRQKKVDEKYLKRGSQPFLQLEVDYGQHEKKYRRSSFNKSILKTLGTSIQPSLRSRVDRKRGKK